MMDSVREFVKTNPLSSLAGAVIVVFVIMLLISIAIGISCSRKKENMSPPQFQTPWRQRAEHMYSGLFSGDLTPSEKALYRKVADRDPNAGQPIYPASALEYMSNKSESPLLTARLYG